MKRATNALPVAVTLLLAALLVPPVSLPRASHDYLVVFDITQSMDVTDYRLADQSVSRLDFARNALRDALPKLPCGSRVGLGAFTEYRSLALLAPVEVCANYNDLLATLRNIDGRMRWAEASQVAKGAFWAVRAARDLEVAPTLVFLSDGHESPPLDSGAPALFSDITPGKTGGWIVGTGGLAPMPIPRTDHEGRQRGFWRADEVARGGNGNEHLSALREPHLRALAAQLGLEYLPLRDRSTLAEAMLDPRFARIRRIPTDLSWVAVSLALGLLCWRYLPSLPGSRRGGAARW